MLRSACNETGAAGRFIGWHTFGLRAAAMSTNRENDRETPPSSPPSPPGRPADPDPHLRVRFTCRQAGGPAGRALAAAQGRAIAGLLDVLADLEVGLDREASG